MALSIVVLAAGQGTRMKSALPKVLHPLCGRPMVAYALDTARALQAQRTVVIVGHGGDRVRASVGDRAECVEQARQLGTGHAVLQAGGALANLAGTVLVWYADMPLLTAETLSRLIEVHATQDATLTMLTLTANDPMGFGRVLRGSDGRVAAIVEDRDCTLEQAAIRELNSGVYAFDAAWLWGNLLNLPLSAKGEYYLTDLVAAAVTQGRRVEALRSTDADELLGINDRTHLARAQAVMRGRINRRHMLGGVTLADPTTTYIDTGVEIGPDTVILPNTHLAGATRIGGGCEIGPNSVIRDSRIGDRCRITASFVEQAVMEDEANVGPFGHLRKGAHLGKGAHMGNFGEVKSSTLGAGSKMGHFSYLGDATVGEDVNIGAGTITCNYDGENKHPTVIEDGAFIGSDTMLVAPVRVGKGARTGAGAVVTRDVPANTVAVGVPARPLTARSRHKEPPSGERE